MKHIPKHNRSVVGIAIYVSHHSSVVVSFSRHRIFASINHDASRTLGINALRFSVCDHLEYYYCTRQHSRCRNGHVVDAIFRSSNGSVVIIKDKTRGWQPSVSMLPKGRTHPIRPQGRQRLNPSYRERKIDVLSKIGYFPHLRIVPDCKDVFAHIRCPSNPINVDASPVIRCVGKSNVMIEVWSRRWWGRRQVQISGCRHCHQPMPSMGKARPILIPLGVPYNESASKKPTCYEKCTNTL